MLQGLNEGQYKAVTSDSEIILNLAGAGTGKTKTLTTRIAYLFKEKRVGLSNVLCLTFTRLAANEMKERIISLVGKTEGEKLFCGTFHKFAVEILREYGFKIGINKNFTIYDEDDKKSIIESIIKEYRLDTKTDSVLKFLEEKPSREENILMRDVQRAASEYEYRLKNNNALDLNMLINYSIELLENHSDVREYYHNLYKYLYCDEFQDTDDVQVKMINLINPDYLYIVGDDNQAIYGWRKAKIEYILNFKEMYPEAEIIKLEENYRCTSPIVSAANSLISYNHQTEKILRANKNGVLIGLKEAATQKDEIEFIANKIKELHNKGENYKSFAILSRGNNALNAFPAVLKRENIPFTFVSSNTDIFKEMHIKSILQFIDAAVNTKNNTLIKKAVNYLDQRIEDTILTKLEILAMENDISLFEAINRYSRKHNNIKAQEFIKTLNTLSDKSPNAYECFTEAVEILHLNDIYKDRVNKLEDIDKAIVKINEWVQLQENILEKIDISSFLRYLMIRDIQEKLNEEKDAVKLMTVHASKGLEFFTIFVIGLNEGEFPHRKATDIEEERRLCYVSISRGIGRAFLTRSKTRLYYDGKTIIETKPSRFIEEMNMNNITVLS